MKLFYSKASCSLAIRILVNELNLTCEFEAVDLRSKKTAADVDYFTINPKGSVPALLTNENEVLTENAVIHQYLADTQQAHHLLPPIGDFKRYRVLEWLNYVTTEMHKGIGILFNPMLSNDEKENVLKPLIKNKLNYLDRHFAQHKFLLGEAYTLPDGYLFVTLNWLKNFNLDIKEWTNLARYFDELKTRPAIEKSLQEEGLI